MGRNSKRDWMDREGGGLVALLLVGVAVLALLPIVRLVGAAIVPHGTLEMAALASWSAPATQRAVWNTLAVAFGSSLVGLVVGSAMAGLLAFTDMRMKRTVAFLFVLSLMIAPQVAALAFKTLAGPSSPLLTMVGLAPPPGTPNPMLGFGGIVLVMGLHHAPLAAVTLGPGFAAIPRSLIEAAEIDGASPRRIVGAVIVPLLQPHLVASSLILFVAGVGNFGIPALLGLPVGIATPPTLVYQKLASFGPALIRDAAAISLLVGVIAGAGVLTAAWLAPREASKLEPGDAMTSFWPLRGWRPAVEAAVWLFLLLTVALPLASLLATSLVPAYGVRIGWDTVTLTQFVEVLTRQDVTLRALRNSLLLAGTATLAVALIAIAFAYTLERRMSRWRAPVLAIIEMPYALPGVVLAIACILLFLKPLPLLGVSLYATPWIILFAYVARFLPLCLKPVLAAMATVDRAAEEAAALDGAGLSLRLRRIVLPTLLPAVSAGALMAFLLAFNELTVSALLWSAGNETLGVALISLEDAGLGSEAAAVGVTSTAIVALLMLVADRLGTSASGYALPWQVLAGTTHKWHRARVGSTHDVTSLSRHSGQPQS